MTEGAADDRQLNRIIIEWPDDAPADPTVQLFCTPGQLFGAAWLLDMIAREQRLDSRIAAAQERAAVAQLAGSIRQHGRS
jgi:hypothetical protein